MKGKSVSSYILSSLHTIASLYTYLNPPYVPLPPFHPNSSLPTPENSRKKRQLPRNSRVRRPLVWITQASVYSCVRACAFRMSVFFAAAQIIYTALYSEFCASTSLHLLRRKLLVLHLGDTLNIVVVKDLRVPAKWVRLKDRTTEWHSVVVTYIIIFQVSTGRSASLKLQSNFSSATGSSVGSWYGAR